MDEVQQTAHYGRIVSSPTTVTERSRIAANLHIHYTKKTEFVKTPFFVFNSHLGGFYLLLRPKIANTHNKNRKKYNSDVAMPAT